MVKENHQPVVFLINIAGTVMELLAREEHCIVLVGHILTRMQEPINAETEKYAQANSKTLQELTEGDHGLVMFHGKARHFPNFSVRSTQITITAADLIVGGCFSASVPQYPQYDRIKANRCNVAVG